MRKILLVCAAGMSTSMLVKNMRKEAEKIGYEAQIDAYPVSEVARVGADADIVFLGPQISFQLAKVKGLVSCPVETVDMATYGMMDGARVIARVREVLGDA